jgi:hypothetical protein
MTIAISVLSGLVFYATGGARLGPGLRGTLLSAVTLSRAGSLLAKLGAMTQDARNSVAGVDVRGSACTSRGCETPRRCAGANKSALDTAVSGVAAAS